MAGTWTNQGAAPGPNTSVDPKKTDIDRTSKVGVSYTDGKKTKD